MNRNFLWIAFVSFALIFTACGEEKKNEENNTEENKEEVKNDPPQEKLSFEKGGLKVYALEGSPAYADAELKLLDPQPGVDLPEGENTFNFEVKNYDLGVQTPDAESKGMANSGKGQHIHLILNNGPYSAHYETAATKELEEGHYVLLAFLSRSYHESVKAPGAFVVRQFVVGAPDSFKEANLKAPHMFYSRPKGTYTGDGATKKLLLDFFLVNCDLSPEGYNVRATVNGNEFIFTKWVPYVVEGLELGEVSVKLELLDKDGNLVPSPFNPVERTVTLEAEAAE